MCGVCGGFPSHTFIIMGYARLHRLLEPQYKNEAHKIYHEIDEKYKHHSDEFVKLTKHIFVELCIEDGICNDARELLRPPLRKGI